MTRPTWSTCWKLTHRHHPSIAAKIAAAGQATDADWFEVELDLAELRALCRAVRGSEVEGLVWELFWVEDLVQHWRE